MKARSKQDLARDLKQALLAKRNESTATIGNLAVETTDIELSDVAQNLNQFSSTHLDMAKRAKRVEGLKALVRAGKYKPDLRAVAEKLSEELGI